MIKVSHLTKSYGKGAKAVDDISFTVNSGEVLGFLGPNGAGKSTTMNILTGYISASAGTVEVDEFNILDNPREVKKKIGYLPEMPPLYLDMSVYDYLDFVYNLKKVKKESKADHIQNIINVVGIDNVKQRRIGNLSKGYKQRVGLAQALIGDPEVLILDEPTVGLDPKQIIEIRNLIKDLGAERTVILSSHILSEVSAICERVIIISNGKIVAEDTPENLAEKISGNNRMKLRISGKKDEIARVLKSVKHVSNVKFIENAEDSSCDFEITCDTKLTTEFNQELFYTCAQNKMPIINQEKIKASLEDIFLKVTAENAAENKSLVNDNVKPAAPDNEKTSAVSEDEIPKKGDDSDESNNGQGV